MDGWLSDVTIRNGNNAETKLKIGFINAYHPMFVFMYECIYIYVFCVCTIKYNSKLEVLLPPVEEYPKIKILDRRRQ